MFVPENGVWRPHAVCCFCHGPTEKLFPNIDQATQGAGIDCDGQPVAYMSHWHSGGTFAPQSVDADVIRRERSSVGDGSAAEIPLRITDDYGKGAGKARQSVNIPLAPKAATLEGPPAKFPPPPAKSNVPEPPPKPSARVQKDQES